MSFRREIQTSRNGKIIIEEIWCGVVINGPKGAVEVSDLDAMIAVLQEAKKSISRMPKVESCEG